MPDGHDCDALDKDMTDRAESSVAQLVRDDLWTDHDAARYSHPEDFPSLIGAWVHQGGSKFQRFFGRLRDTYRWLEFFHDLPHDKSKARFRGVVSAMAAEPLRALPNTVERTYSTPDFQWYMCNRIQAQQPAAEDITQQFYKCIHGVVIRDPIADGRHFRRCRRHNVMGRIHDSIRDLLHTMSRAAGLTSVREPGGLLSDCVFDRPGDWFVSGWHIKGVRETKHAIDLTLPLTDSGWATLSLEVQREHAGVVGSTGKHAEQKKRDNIGTLQEQRARGNSDTMMQRCKDRNIHFWPIALEGDGVPSENFISYINHVCDAAVRLTGANRASFKSYFMSRLSNTLHQVSAQLALRQTAAARAQLVFQQGPAEGLRGNVDFGQELQTMVPAYVSKRREWRNRNTNLGVRLRAT